ncbi:MAG: cellobiose phosphorylase, partial [Anaerolineales bacterium]|nr:cellobiose phosphorylase [Anaerolineales bacterium]
MNKQPHDNSWKFIDESGSFSLQDPDLSSHLYFPLANEARMLSVVTPTLNGDIKTDHNSYLSQPLSVFDLHNTRSGRNFWVYGEKIGPWSATGNSAPQLTARFHKGREKVSLQAGFLWHEVTRENPEKGIKAEITNFVPYGKDQVELMRVSITNLSAESLHLTPTAAVPIFGRSADNLRDHRHVTSLLNRITCTGQGVLMNPTLSFDERGHIPNDMTYGVLGVDTQDQDPTGFFPVLNDFIGEGGTLDWPRAIVHNLNPAHFPGDKEAGHESLGGLQFP